jgi:hypothetical protein
MPHSRQEFDACLADALCEIGLTLTPEQNARFFFICANSRNGIAG